MGLRLRGALYTQRKVPGCLVIYPLGRWPLTGEPHLTYMKPRVGQSEHASFVRLHLYVCGVILIVSECNAPFCHIEVPIAIDSGLSPGPCQAWSVSSEAEDNLDMTRCLRGAIPVRDILIYAVRGGKFLGRPFVSPYVQ